MPTPETWLHGAVTDATRDGGDDVRPVLEALAKALTALRKAEWNADAAREPDSPADAARDAPRRGPTTPSKASRG